MPGTIVDELLNLSKDFEIPALLEETFQLWKFDNPGTY